MTARFASTTSSQARCFLGAYSSPSCMVHFTFTALPRFRSPSISSADIFALPPANILPQHLRRTCWPLFISGSADRTPTARALAPFITGSYAPSSMSMMPFEAATEIFIAPFALGRNSKPRTISYLRLPSTIPSATTSSILSRSGARFIIARAPSGSRAFPAPSPNWESTIRLTRSISPLNAGRASPGGVISTGRVAPLHTGHSFSSRMGRLQLSHQRRCILPRYTEPMRADMRELFNPFSALCRAKPVQKVLNNTCLWNNHGGSNLSR